MTTAEPLLQAIRQRRPIVGAAVGAGLSAMAASEGGADFLMVLSAGHFRSQGVSSMAALLPYANANTLTWEAALRYIHPRVSSTPLILGICAQDPNLNLKPFLARAKAHGFAGVTNFPSVGFIGGVYREALEEFEMGFEAEARLVEAAKEAGLVSIGFCFRPEEAARMTRAGADVLCLDLGWTEWRSLDSSAHQAALDGAVRSILAQTDAAKAVRPDPYTVVFGGPVLLPRDAEFIYERTGVLGYIGGSSIERHPAETGIRDTVSDFKKAFSVERRTDRLGALTGSSPAMREIFRDILQVARSDASVFILGESGTGKELAAREIHRLSRRSAGPLVGWNCAATAESLAMSELFGHEKGAFTGAVRSHTGKFEAARGGTLFMDEVTDLSPSLQASLLRALQEREIVPVGGEKPIKVDARIVAATNSPVRTLVSEGKFRLDLFYRLSTVVLRMPPLRERREDIPLLVAELSQQFAAEYGIAPPRLNKACMAVLTAHSWPGNVRELRNVVERCFIQGSERALSPARMKELIAAGSEPDARPAAASPAGRLQQALDTIARNRGNKAAAARELGVTRRTLYNWLEGS